MIPDLERTFLAGLEAVLAKGALRKKHLRIENIEQMFEDFRFVHQCYMDTLRAFRRRVAEEEDLTAITRSIQEERLFTEARRAEIKAFVGARLDRAERDPQNQEVLEFCYQLRDYLADPRLGMDADLVGQRWYTSLGFLFEALEGVPAEDPAADAAVSPAGGEARPLEALQRIVHEAGGDKKAAALKVIDTLVEEMQRHYARICGAYARIEEEVGRTEVRDLGSLLGARPGMTILFMSADPTDASRLRLGEELREIHEKLQLGKLRDRFRLEQRTSVRPADISQALLDVQPQIVHFSGHGASTGALCFERPDGKACPIDPDALAALFEQFADQVTCVVLNACFSEGQAKAIAKHIQYVVGMNQAIDDRAAIAFAIGFYQALGAGRTIEGAYRLGCVQIRLQGIPEHLTPVLIQQRAEEP